MFTHATGSFTRRSVLYRYTRVTMARFISRLQEALKEISVMSTFDSMAQSLMAFDKSLEQLSARYVAEMIFFATYPDVRKLRLALDGALDNLRSDGEHVIDSLMQLYATRRPYSDDLIRDLQRRQRVFRGILAHGATRQSVLDAFIAEYGALDCFELPAWLETMRPRFVSASASQAAAAYQEAMDRIMAEAGGDASQVFKKTGVGREVFAALLWGQGNSLVRAAPNVTGLNDGAFRGFMALQNASTVYTQEHFPLTFAKIVPDWDAAKKKAMPDRDV